MIPQVLSDVASFLTNDNIQLPSGSGEPRQDSAAAEGKIISLLQNKRKWDISSPNIGSGHNRNWYDVKIDGHYCNIKVSNLKGHDNTQAKKAIHYFLTGKNLSKVPDEAKKFFKIMSENEIPCEKRDFYFIVVSKPEADAFIVSLKTIAEIKPAHSNPPFQCKWTNCKTPVNRTWEEAKHYLLKCWALSIKNNIEKLNGGMPEHYPEFFE